MNNLKKNKSTLPLINLANSDAPTFVISLNERSICLICSLLSFKQFNKSMRS